MKIYLPNSAFLGNLDPFIRNFDPSNPTKLEITANEKWISVHPIVLSMVTALGLKVGKENITCPGVHATSAGYLERMGLFKILGINSGITITEHEATGRFIPITQIKNSSEASSLLTDMIPLLKVPNEQAETIVHIISELVRNVLEHACTLNGAIACAQYYKKTNRICIGIADTGIGIRETITQSHQASDDLEAIKLALTPGITGTTQKLGGTDQNAGFGLYLIKSIAVVNRNFFVIYSGSGFYKLLRESEKSRGRIKLNIDPFKDRHSKDGNMPNWNGTAVGIDITLNQTAEFLGLLKAIRAVYDDVIEANKKAHKKPKFI